MLVPRLPQLEKGVFGIRRHLFIIPALLVIVALLVAAAPAEGRSRMKLGVSQTVGSRDIQAVKNFTASMGGKKPASWTIWSTWGNPSTKKFPSAFVAELKQYGVTPFIWWEPMKHERGTCEFARLRNIAKGKQDSYIKSWARAAKRSKTTVLMRWAGEINGRYFPWTIGRCGNQLKHYKAAWNRIYNIVRNKVGAKNVKIVQSFAKQTCAKPGCNPYKRFFMKKSQFTAFSSFNWGNHPGKTWKSMGQGVKNPIKHIRKFSKKPLMIVESASNGLGGDKPTWIRTGYQTVYTKYPFLKSIIYLNVDLRNVGHPNWSLNSPSEARTAYKELLNQSKFSGRF